MSSFGKSSSSLETTGSLYRSQSLASLGGEKMVLGESFRSSYTLSTHRAAVLKELGLNSKVISKIPETPRPKRTLDVFIAVIKGLRFVTQVSSHYDDLLDTNCLNCMKIGVHTFSFRIVNSRFLTIVLVAKVARLRPNTVMPSLWP